MGHGPRGLQQQRRRLGLFFARSGPLAGVSLGRGRAGGHLRRQAAALLRPGLVEWEGSDPQGASLRADQREGNHGEDVKEYYFYVDSTPTHSYMKYLYKYPQAAYPYARLVDTNKGRSRDEMEYELLDTGVFDGDRYFDVFVEYAKAGPEDILVQVTVVNRGPEAAELHVLPTLWFRNTWSWTQDAARPLVRDTWQGRDRLAEHPELGGRSLLQRRAGAALHRKRDQQRADLRNPQPHALCERRFDNYLVQGQQAAVNPDLPGTKVAAHYRLAVGPGQSAKVRLRLTDQALPRQPEDRRRCRPFGPNLMRPWPSACRRPTSSTSR